ncbi:MAG: hypothetical protein HUU55_05025 [Myxococcales bacterium]|nr:hypothetical protein [Myxococcales bacterium]
MIVGEINVLDPSSTPTADSLTRNELVYVFSAQAQVADVEFFRHGIKQVGQIPLYFHGAPTLEPVLFFSENTPTSVNSNRSEISRPDTNCAWVTSKKFIAMPNAPSDIDGGFVIAPGEMILACPPPHGSSPGTPVSVVHRDHPDLEVTVDPADLSLVPAALTSGGKNRIPRHLAFVWTVHCKSFVWSGQIVHRDSTTARSQNIPSGAPTQLVRVLSPEIGRFLVSGTEVDLPLGSFTPSATPPSERLVPDGAPHGACLPSYLIVKVKASPDSLVPIQTNDISPFSASFPTFPVWLPIECKPDPEHRDRCRFPEPHDEWPRGVFAGIPVYVNPTSVIDVVRLAHHNGRFAFDGTEPHIATTREIAPPRRPKPAPSVFMAVSTHLATSFGDLPSAATLTFGAGVRPVRWLLTEATVGLRQGLDGSSSPGGGLGVGFVVVEVRDFTLERVTGELSLDLSSGCYRAPDETIVVPLAVDMSWRAYFDPRALVRVYVGAEFVPTHAEFPNPHVGLAVGTVF